MTSSRIYVIVVACVAGVALVGLFTALPASAHHAIQAEYDTSKTESFTGLLTRFAMVNPHVRWFFDEKKPDGTVVKWEMSGAGPGALRAGGLVRMFEVGTTYKVTYAPAWSRPTLGRLRTLTAPDGRVITLFHEDPTSPLNK